MRGKILTILLGVVVVACSAVNRSDEEIDAEFTRQAVLGCVSHGKHGTTPEALRKNCQCVAHEELLGTPPNIRRLLVEHRMTLTAEEFANIYDSDRVNAGIRMNCPAAYKAWSQSTGGG
ncbi:hypothetical protein FRZ61_05400 [Hypericibacter adhaerens]|uniref:Lipoprotein n=1 Tax=Hypericibacter adhaerens TaxID=2602016 RepID=A0A5J6MSN3_9PROT|nr:hypothetical protein FRZ61_05400 [Hypericibacter adhaerens]